MRYATNASIGNDVCYYYAMMNGRILEALRASGIDGEKILAVERFLSTGRGTQACLACGSRAMRLDYTCKGCSDLKAENPRLFWHRVKVTRGEVR